MKAVGKVKKSKLPAAHKKARLDFALKHQHWTVEDWKRVIWSDKTKINRIGSNGKQWVWKGSDEGRFVDRLVRGTAKHGGGSMVVWACVGWNGVGILAEVEGRMDAKQYVKNLEECLLETIQKLEVADEDLIIQQDNDPKHTFKLTSQWFKDQGIVLLPWPAQSPDLNSIEHL